ncbi:MAG: DUF2617 family protein [Planctomycetota bacterium]|nr:MAG: DUF2617 family protein [Planctomycetota bacterium]REK26553.1 MAG: DUF2617 family protein [Planctomycetota bacterium]REK34040.1 MAG: DUF2617 family protein [Planctomycetota bacterium]
MEPPGPVAYRALRSGSRQIRGEFLEMPAAANSAAVRCFPIGVSRILRKSSVRNSGVPRLSCCSRSVMKLEFARPDASQLVFQVFERSVHPELFDIYAETHIAAPGFEGVVRICRAGHVVEFRREGRHLTEVVASRDQQLPRRGRCASQLLHGGRDFDCEVNGIAYCCSAHVEHVDAEVFSELQDELSVDASRALVSYRFPGANRLQPGPVSVIQAEATESCLVLHAFHTFPENRAILRTQSLFEY